MRSVSRHSHRDYFYGASRDRKSTRLNSSHGYISYAVFCLKNKKRSRRATAAEQRGQSELPRCALTELVRSGALFYSCPAQKTRSSGRALPAACPVSPPSPV